MVKCLRPRRMHILRCMGSKFCVKFQRAPLKFHTKFWTHTPQNMHFTVFYFCLWVTISSNCDVISLSETAPRQLHTNRDEFIIIKGNRVFKINHWINNTIAIWWTSAMRVIALDIIHTIKLLCSGHDWSHVLRVWMEWRSAEVPSAPSIATNGNMLV